MYLFLACVPVAEAIVPEGANLLRWTRRKKKKGKTEITVPAELSPLHLAPVREVSPVSSIPSIWVRIWLHDPKQEACAEIVFRKHSNEFLFFSMHGRCSIGPGNRRFSSCLKFFHT